DSGAPAAVTVDLATVAPTITTVLGSAYSDTLIGRTAGGGVLIGNAGNDTIVSTGSADTMTGGTGGDVFAFASATATGSLITDFESTTDSIDLRPVLAAISYQGGDP